jgi:hypothetical protein
MKEEGEKIKNDQLTFKGQNTCKGAKKATKCA